jgi:predicted PurR-regulated permease PerM
LVLWVALAVLIGLMLWAARKVLLPYVIGLVIAYLLLPIVNWLDRHMPTRFKKWRIARALAIILTYFLAFAIVAGIIAFFVPIVVEQVQILIEYWPSLSESVEDWADRGLGWYANTVPTDWQEAVENTLKGLLNDILSALRDGLVATFSTVFGTISYVIGLIVIPFWLFYILHDQSEVSTGLYNTLPRQLRDDIRCLLSLLDDVLSAYIRGQLLLCIFVGGMATIALWIIGVPFALLLGIVAGIFEALPYVGPILGAVPAVIVALLAEPSSALWVAFAFFIIQQVENLILVPRISGRSVKLHPALVMVVLVVGNELAGFVGMLIAVPVTAMLRDIFRYLYLRFLDEPLAPEEAMTSIRSDQEVQLGV